MNRRAVRVYRREKRWERVQWDASGRSVLGEGRHPVNMEDANTGLGKRSEVCLEDWVTEVRPSGDDATSRSSPVP